MRHERPAKREKGVTDHELLTDLAAGELSPLAAWRLRRRIARDAALAREWASVERLWRELAGLRMPEAPLAPTQRPTWPLDLGSGQPESRTIRIGGFVMNRRLVIAGLAASVCTVTGAFAAHYLHYDPFVNFIDRKGHIFQATGEFRGEVRLYDAGSHLIGSYGTSDTRRGIVEATVTVGDTTYLIRGAGRHEIRDAKGALVGYAELVPQTEAERNALTATHERELGHEAMYPGASGEQDGTDFARGFFGEGENRLNWTLGGAGKAVFRLEDSGKIVRIGKVTPLNEPSVERYASQATSQFPSKPVLSWRIGEGGEKTFRIGYGVYELTPPGGPRLTVEIMPLPQPNAPAKVTPSGSSTASADRQRGIEERLKGVSTSDMTGLGMAKGSFRDNVGSVRWEMHGIGDIRFRRVRDGKIVLTSNALPLGAEKYVGRTIDNQPMPRDPQPPPIPVFVVMTTNLTTSETGYGSHPLSLPDGTKLSVEILRPRE